jgi:hypothetical protein
MKLLTLTIPALLLATSAMAQEVPADSVKDLWCGIAFGIVSENAPTDVTEDQKAVIQAYTDGGQMLIERAKTAHLANGYTDESFATHLDSLTSDVTVQVNASDNSAQFSFEECSALLSL